jgi:TRAP-type mannitol/chloroaromatic compound transport system permease large subunit
MLLLALATILTLCVLAVIGMPIIIAMAASVVTFLALSGGWDMALPQQTLSGLGSYILITLPLFILAGGIMNASGIADRLFDFAGAMVGWMRGGLAHVNIASSLMFGGMIGTSVADLAGTGSIIIPKMKENGYPGPFSASLTATSSGIGILIPPSSPMILYSAVTGTSLGALFLAGIVPGILMALVLMLIVTGLARRKGWKPMQSFVWSELMRTGVRAALPMGLPVLVIGGLVFGLRRRLRADPGDGRLQVPVVPAAARGDGAVDHPDGRGADRRRFLGGARLGLVPGAGAAGAGRLPQCAVPLRSRHSEDAGAAPSGADRRHDP